MALVIDDLKDNKLYRKQVFLPSDSRNKRKNSAIFLMTPNYASSVKTMNNPKFLNNGRFESYYTEKDITFILTEDHRLLDNSDEIAVTENSIPQYTRVTCTTRDELDSYGISYGDDLKSFTGQIFVDLDQKYQGCLILTNYNSMIYKAEAYSDQMKRDLIQSAMIFFNIKSARIWDESDRNMYLDYGFNQMDHADKSCLVMVREEVSLFENAFINKLDMEIKLWEAQIKITELIIKNFNDDNWMSHLYKDLKRKLNKIPLDDYIESADDTIERWKDKLNDQKATLDFFAAVKSIEAKDIFDMSEIVDEYVDWVQSLACPKTLKLKIINETIDSYNKTIKECEYNLKRYKNLDDAAKRIENVTALATKIYSIFGFISGGPLSIIKGSLIKSVLPKSQKKNVLSEAELEAKIEIYTKIVETLEEEKKKTQALDESTVLEVKSGSAEDTLKRLKGFISCKQMRGNIYLVHKNRLYNDDGKNYKEDWLYILTDDNKIAGYMLLYNKNKEVYSINTHKQYRNHGYATQLLICAVNDLGSSLLSIRLSDENGAAHRLYLKLGFKEYDRGNEFIYLKIDHKISEQKYLRESMLTENYMFSKDNLYINFDKFESGKTNMCFVTGLSGSGKSTLAETLATKYKADWIELDIFEHCGGFSDDKLKETGEVFYDYLSSHKEIWERLVKRNIHGKELRTEVSKFIKYVISWCSSRKDKKYIIEGIQIYNLMEKSQLKNNPLVLVNASMLKSLVQRLKRTWDNRKDEDSDWKNQLLEFPQMISYYVDSEKEFSEFKKAVLNESTKESMYYFVSVNSEDDEGLYYAENGIGIYDTIENAIASYPHKKYKLYVHTATVYGDSEVTGNNKIKYEGMAYLDLAGEINVTYNNDKSLRSYSWIKKYGEDGVAINTESVIRSKSSIIDEYVVPYINEPSLTTLGLQTENTITFLEGNDNVLVEGDAAYNAILRRILYSERIKNHKEIMLLYEQVKQDCRWIKYSFVNYDRYVNKNLFIDWSYYTKSFFKNNTRRYDKAVDLYFEFVNRFLEDNRLNTAGYSKKTVFVPVDDWIPQKDREYWDYKLNLNPISIIYRLAFRDIDKLKAGWGNYTFVFTGRNGYFKINFSEFEKNSLARFLQNVKALVNNEPIVDTDEPDNSVNGIVNQVIDKIEADSSIRINNLTGAEKSSISDIIKRVDDADISSEELEDSKEEELVAAITTAANSAKDDTEVLNKINNDDYIKQLVIDLRNSSPDGVTIEPTRAARMRKINDEFVKKTIAGKTVQDIISNFNDDPLPETQLPIDTINDDWKRMKYMNHGKVYDLNADIVRCLNHFSTATAPVSILDVDVQDTSTSEDWVDTWTVKCEDSYGKRFTLKFDIPRLMNSRSMHLRGNKKTINGQLMNLPIIKTEENTCQMTSNYNKIFFSGYGTSVGKSYVIADRLIKTFNKMEKNPDITIEFGDNSLICAKYELPTDYIDIASVVSKITIVNRHVDAKYTLFFNQDELFAKYGKLIKNKDSFPIGIIETGKNSEPKILYSNLEYPVSWDIYDKLSVNDKFTEVYNTTSTSVRYTYSKASILNTHIPIAVLIGYYIGLIPMLDRLGAKYEVSDKRPKYDKNTQDLIKLEDAFIVYDLTYDTSMLLNGLKECDLASYSLKDVNSKKMWVECLDNFGGRLKADGLDMFLDLMIDPITAIVCDKYQLPKDFIDGLLYANMLLSDNKYNKHVDVTGNRYRTNEIIAGYTYKALCTSYTQYRRDLRSGRDSKMTMKQSAVLDLLFADNTFGDLSALSDLLEIESLNATSFKGLAGMNSDRAYGLDKRTFDKSMVNLLALSTGFAANAGITRQSTIDMDIDSARGYIKNASTDKMSITKTFCMTEAMTPFGTTSDDSFRSAMTFIQTSKHGMRTKVSDPLLVTNGADQALPYMTSDTFTYKAKQAGKVKEMTDDYMILEYKNGETEVVDLRERILKNSDGGMYIAVKLDTELKVGNVFSSREIVAYDKTSYSKGVGPTSNLAYDIGTFVKFAIINSDEGFEDSCIETEWIADAMSSVVVLNKEYTLPKDTNVYFMAKKGQAIQEGDPLLIFQNAFDEEDANMLIKTLSDEGDDDIVAELGRIPIYSKVTGVVKDIKIMRTVEKEDLSSSLKKIVNDYEKDVSTFNKVLEKYDKAKVRTADATYKLEPTGKLKNAADSVRVEFSLAYEDKFSIGDKTVCYSALKGVSKGKIPLGLEPYSVFRPDEKIHYIQSTNGDMKRMVGSILKIGALNKVMVELARQSCDIMGIKWKYFDEQ